MAASSSSFVDLVEYVDFQNIECLNQHSQYPLTNALRQKNDDLYLRSDEDSDAQLLIRIPFNQPVKLHTIKVRAPSDDSAPQCIKIFSNRGSMGFGEADEEEPVQCVTFEADNFEGDVVKPLRFVKFQNVTAIILYVCENRGADFTRINRLELLGSAIHDTKMSELKKQGHDHDHE
eukprot:GILK01004060.1.p1 GENE.GILK01004060.1~~GILK01004060.1.p1  ORF type:complete len:193 (+),score=38.75 GILK01004060.1:52-579(+)